MTTHGERRTDGSRTPSVHVNITRDEATFLAQCERAARELDLPLETVIERAIQALDHLELPPCTNQTPWPQRANRPAIDRKGHRYGWWCHSGKHVWTTQEDATKCCHPGWTRAAAVRTTDLGTVFYRWWQPTSQPGEQPCHDEEPS